MNSKKIIGNLTIPKSVNLHITERCNYRCSFCFSKYGNNCEELSEREWVRIINELIYSGCEKINFAGGEPTLIPFLPNLIKHSHSIGAFISIISNGTGINPKFLNKCGENLDLIGLSIDSASDEIERKLGRTLNSGKFCSYSHVDIIKNSTRLINEFGIPLKINTTITPLNWREDMHDIIIELNPIRWKVFEVQIIRSVNDSFKSNFGELTSSQFEDFERKHADLCPVIETNEIMRDSYWMISPDGRFYRNHGDGYDYSQPLLLYGVKEATSKFPISQEMFSLRNGDYYEKLKHGSIRRKVVKL